MIHPTPARRTALPARLALACAVALSAACGGGGGGTPPPTLDAVEISPATTSIAKGRTQAFTATARFSDGSAQDVTAAAAWTSSSGAAAMAGAVATAVAEGEATIAADYGGRSGTAALAVGPPVVDSVTVSPASATLAKGLTATFAATARWSDDTTSDVTATATWAVEDASVATASGNVVTATSVGATAVRAVAHGRTGSADLEVTPAAVAAITLSPVNATLAAGLTLGYDAVAVYTDGTKQDVTAGAAWEATPASVATIAAGGLASGVAPGAATVSATYAGASAETALTVTSATLAALSISPRAPSVPLGVQQPFTAIGVFSDGTRQELTAQVAWTSSDEAVATVSAEGVATPAVVGSATIAAAIGAISDATTLTVTEATLDALVVDPPAASIAAGTSAPFTATGIFSDGSTADLTALAAWSSSDAAVATVSNDAGTSGVATGVAPGTATFTATFGTATDTAEVTVTDAVLVSLAVAPADASAPAGSRQQLAATGTFSDGSTQDLTTAAAWTSSDPAVAAVSNAPGEEGVVTAVAPGTVTVGAAYAAVSATTSFTVTDVTLEAVEVTPEVATLPAGYTLRFRATARYSDLTTRDVTAEATWLSSDPLVATVSNALGSQGLAAGVAASATPVEIRAALAGVVGSAELTVTSEALVSIAVAPNPFAVAVRGRLQLTATGTFSEGTVLDVTNACVWSTSSRTVARVSQGGLVSGISPGAVTIGAKKSKKQGTASGAVD